MKHRYTMERQIHFATNWRTSTTLMFGRVGWIVDDRFVMADAPQEAHPVAESPPPSTEALQPKLPIHFKKTPRIQYSE